MEDARDPKAQSTRDATRTPSVASYITSLERLTYTASPHTIAQGDAQMARQARHAACTVGSVQTARIRAHHAKEEPTVQHRGGMSAGWSRSQDTCCWSNPHSVTKTVRWASDTGTVATSGRRGQGSEWHAMHSAWLQASAALQRAQPRRDEKSVPSADEEWRLRP